MDQKTEAEIVARVLEGDRQAYALLVEEYKKPVFNLAYRMTNNLEDARDLAQESFLRAYENLAGYDRTRSFYTWLYTISLNIIRNYLKKKNSKYTDYQSGYSNMEILNSKSEELACADALHKEREEMLAKCLTRLSPELRELIVLRFYQTLSFEEISRITGLSQSAVKMRIYRALEKMQKFFKEM